MILFSLCILAGLKNEMIIGYIYTAKISAKIKLMMNLILGCILYVTLYKYCVVQGFIF